MPPPTFKKKKKKKNTYRSLQGQTGKTIKGLASAASDQQGLSEGSLNRNKILIFDLVYLFI